MILVDIDKITFRSDEERRVFYVGASRAKHFLDIFTVLEDKGIPDLAKAITGLKARNPKAAIGSGLKVKILSDVN